MDEFTRIFSEEWTASGEENFYRYYDPATGELMTGYGEMPLEKGYPLGMDPDGSEAIQYDMRRAEIYGLSQDAITPEAIKKAQESRQEDIEIDPNWTIASRLVHDYMNRAHQDTVVTKYASPGGTAGLMGVQIPIEEEAVQVPSKRLADDKEYAAWGVAFMNKFNNNIGKMVFDIGELSQAPPQVQKAMYYLMETADREGILASNFWSGLGWQAIDPFNWVGLGTFGIGVAGKAAGKKLTKEAFKAALKEMVSLKPTGVKMAMSAEGSMFALADNMARQTVKIRADQQDGYSGLEAGIASTVGAGVGYQFPSVLEGGGKAIAEGAKKGIKKFDELTGPSVEEQATRNVGAIIEETPTNQTNVEQTPLPDKGDLVVDEPPKVNPVVDDLPLVDFDSLEGVKIFPIAADLTKAGGTYEGIDSSKIDVPIILQGGPDYGNLESSRAAGVTWAFDGSGKATQKLSKDAEYALVVAMKPDSHRTNATVTKAMLETTLAYIRDGRMSADIVSKLDAEIGKPRAGTANVSDWPGLGSPEAADYIRNATFEQRKTIMAVMTGDTAQNNGAPNLQKILDATADARYVGLNSYDSIMLMKIDRSGGTVKLGEETNTPEHLSYGYAIKGTPVARMPMVSAQKMFPDWFAKRQKQEAEMRETGLTTEGKPLTRPPEAGRDRAFYLSLPVEAMTAEKIADMKAVAVEKIQSPLQAKLLVNALDDGWQTTDDAVGKGGITALDWVKEASASPESATLTFPDGQGRTEQGRNLQKKVNSGQLKLYKLKDSRTFFGIEKDYDYFDEYGLSDEAEHWMPDADYDGPPLTNNETALVSVVSNDFGAKGIGATTVMKAIEEGVTVLDCFMVRSDKFPAGFLPSFYASMGFEVVGTIKFDPNIVLSEPGGARKLADMKEVWKSRGWKEGDGFPDIAVMKYQGDENGRDQFTRRFIADGEESLIGGAITDYKQQAGEPDANASKQAVEETRASDGSGDTGDIRAGDRRGSTSKLVGVGQEILKATDVQLENLGISPETVKRIRDEMQGVTP